MSDVMPYASTKYKELTSRDYSLWKKAFTKTATDISARFNPEFIISHHLWLLSALAKEPAPEIPVITVSHGSELRQLNLASQFADGVIAGCSRVEHVIARDLINAVKANKVFSAYYEKGAYHVIYSENRVYKVVWGPRPNHSAVLRKPSGIVTHGLKAMRRRAFPMLASECLMSPATGSAYTAAPPPRWLLCGQLR